MFIKDKRRHWRSSGVFIVNFEQLNASWDTFEKNDNNLLTFP